MDKDCESIRQEALKFSWYMRGGLSYNDAMNLSPDERKLISGIIKENIETTKKTGLNWF
jgi:hypothetical protein